MLARKRIEAAPFPVEYLPIGGEAIAAPDQSFDCVVSTFTLCSIPDPAAALAHKTVQLTSLRDGSEKALT